jgi:Tol biopolymer transport system component
MIAWTGIQLTVYNRESGKSTSFPVSNPRFMAWSPDGLLYILTRDANGDVVLSSLDVVHSRVAVLASVEADAVFVFPDGKSLVLASAPIKQMSIGTQLNARIAVFSVGSNTSRTIYRQSRTSMSKNLDAALWTAWLHAGINQLDLALLVMEHVTPPLLASYTVVNALDPATGELTPLTAAESRRRYLSGSWSPNGKRLALTDADGRLEIRNRTGDSIILDPSVTSIYPSWNPQGSTLYAGGFLVDSSGTNREQLIADAQRSIGTWSPDGTMLAVAGDDELLLFTGIRTAFIPPDTPLNKASAERFSLLRSLVLDGSISRDEYRERRNRLLEKTGEAQ